MGGPIGVHLDVGWPVSSIAASVAANCWSLDIDLETSVIAVRAGGGRLHGGSGLGGE